MTTSSSDEQREECPLCLQSDDTYCAHPGPNADTWTCPACGHNWHVAVSEPVDRRIYPTELERTSASRGRWGLYIDGHPVAYSSSPLGYLDAQQWANAHLGERVNWLTGRTDPAEQWYWVANPAQPR